MPIKKHARNSHAVDWKIEIKKKKKRISRKKQTIQKINTSKCSNFIPDIWKIAASFANTSNSMIYDIESELEMLRSGKLTDSKIEASVE